MTDTTRTDHGALCGRCRRPELVHCPVCATCEPDDGCELGCVAEDEAGVAVAALAVAAWEEGRQRAALALIAAARSATRPAPQRATGSVVLAVDDAGTGTGGR